MSAPAAADQRFPAVERKVVSTQAGAIAHPNIAFIKYWGNQDHALRLPSNGSLSMTLGGLATRTLVTFDPALTADRVTINDEPTAGRPLARIQLHLDRIRALASLSMFADVASVNNYPSDAGIASSAAGFAALTVAGCRAAGLDLDRRSLSRLARAGSGSAARSIYGGFVEWYSGDDANSYAEPLAPEDHWSLVDWIAVVDSGSKPVGSSEGHRLAETSPLQDARLSGAQDRLVRCRRAVLERDFSSLATIAELDSDLMHAVMMTSNPPVLYWAPATIELMKTVRQMRAEGTQVFYTIDAGPNVHCICPAHEAKFVGDALGRLASVQQLFHAHVGGPAELLSGDLSMTE
ncbi:MAG: diphosphomevalonate decarboxylase [Anaerolineales bacterium]